MPYITPNSTIYLCRRIPLDPDYQHTWYFTSSTVQLNKIISYLKPSTAQYSFLLEKYTYQRVNNNTIKVSIPADYLYDINYMAFQNTAYSSKWFYAFVNNVNYVNDHTTEIQYTIDIMQTWLLDYEYGQCFIERQHQAGNDEVGANIVEEGIEVGEMRSLYSERIDLSEQNAMVLYTDDVNKSGLAHNGIYNGLQNNPKPLKMRTYRYDFRIDWDPINLLSKIRSETPTPTGARYDITFIPEGETSETGWSATPKIKLHKTGAVSSYYSGWIECRFVESYLYIKTYQTIDSAVQQPLDPIYSSEFIERVGEGEYRIPTDMFGVDHVLYGYVYFSTTWYTTSQNDGKEIKDYLDGINDPSAVVNVYQYPAWIDKDVAVGANFDDDITQEKKLFKMNTLPVINKKCYTYPYNYLVISNNIGSNMEYRWENGLWNAYYQNRVINFNMYGTRWGNPAVMLYPVAYKGIVNDYESAIIINNFPQCAWTNDVYKTWWNQNKASAQLNQALGAVGGIINTVSSAASGNIGGVASGAISAVTPIANLMAKKSDMKAIPPSAQGQTSIDGLNNGIGRTGYTIYWMAAKQENLNIIDSYFQCYGYKQNKVDTPNIHARSKYTYIKTQGCIIHAKSNAGLPADAEKEITAIMDRGITFWVPSLSNTYDIGDYFNPTSRLDAKWNEPI